MIAATYTDIAETTVDATIDGCVWSGVRVDSDAEISRVIRDWISEGGTPDAYVASLLPVEVRSQDLFALFTPADATKIQTAIGANVNFWLLWSALQAQQDPMSITSARFQQGWAALTTVLGRSRMNEIATALDAFELIAT